MVQIKEDLFREFALWGSVLVIKMLLMSMLTGRQRFSKNVFANAEDKMDRNSKIIADDPDVERVRRAHRNDLENILPWFVMTPIWLTTGPSPYLASILIKTFAVARIGHTVSYVFLQKQPHRAITFFAGYGVTLYQAVSTIMHYF